MDTPSTSSLNQIDDTVIIDTPKQPVSENAALDAANNLLVTDAPTVSDISHTKNDTIEPEELGNQSHFMPTDMSIEHIAKPQSIDLRNNNNINSNDNNHHQQQQPESNIKLKRCKHGRIIIKDLSKKKLTQPCDGLSTNDVILEEKSTETISDSQQLLASSFSPINESSAESNANRDINSLNPIKLAGEEAHSLPKSPKGLPPQPSSPIIDETANIVSKRTVFSKNLRGSNDVSKSRDRHRSPNRDRRSRSGSRSRSRTRTRSRSRSRRRSRSRSPRRRSRYSRSPSSKLRSTSRERVRSPHGRYNSRSPRREGRSPLRRKRNRKSSRRRRRRQSSNNKRDQLSHSRSRSPRGRKTSRSLSRSVTPNDYSSSRRTRIEDSPSPARDHYRNDRYTSHDRHLRRREPYADKKSPTRVHQEEHKSRTDTVDSGVSDSFNVPTNQLVSHGSIPSDKSAAIAGDIAHLDSKRSQSSHLIHPQASNARLSPKTSPVNKDAGSPRESSTARSPATPSNDSASSDIYDPEGPVIPISPGDSPPLSPLNNIAFAKDIFRQNNEKNGDDDVPSSAVQLNHQEKYLQKLNRQERVVEEVKMSLRPYYQNRSIDKEQYKDVLRRAVPKICHSKKGEINPNKIRTLVDAYVKKMKHRD